MVKSLLHRKLRTFLTTLGIAIGVALVFSLVSLNGGMRESLVDQMEIFGADMMTVTGKAIAGMGFSGTFTQEDVEVVERVPVVRFAIGTYYTGLEMEVKGNTFFKSVIGIESNKMSLFKNMYSGVGMASGRFLNDGELGKIVIGPRFAEDYDLRVGNQVKLAGETFRIVGIMESIGNGEDDRNIYTNADDLWRLSGSDEFFIMIFGKVHDSKLDSVTRALKRHRGVEDFEVMTTESWMETMDSILGIVNVVFLGVASISILVGCVGVANTMYVSVLERVREIGVLKSIGASQFQILVMFLLEAGLVGVVGGIAGIVLGYLIAFGFTTAATVSGFMNLKPLITPYLFLISAGVAFVVGMLAGLLPARWASKLQPVDALRYE